MRQERSFSLRLLTENRQEVYGVATLWIIVFHSYLCEVYYGGLIGNLITYGNMGCEIFLFLSGICLYFSYCGNERLLPFLKRRLVRLYVPIVLICTWYWLYQLYTAGVSLGSLGRLASHYLTLSFWLRGDTQIWFVSALLLCYFLYPYIYHILFDGKHTAFSLVFLLVLTVGVTLLLQHWNQEFYGSTLVGISRMPVFLMGCALGRAVYREKPLPKWLIPLCAVIFCGVIAVLNLDILHGLERRYIYLPGGIALTVVLAWLFHRVTWRSFHAVFRFLGNMSLELYLCNIILIRLYKLLPIYHPDAPDKLAYLLLLAVNIALAYVAYRLGKLVTPPVQRWLLGETKKA